ncbi:DUF218 domain-containing protein [Candidatus Sumerlaeota bacterium]|nr:ElyC/SanA/YdcF family protein [Candidatus Sumerlaeales bacterium]NLD61049.1 DUF218 domain-containing protein [Candidatus Sumerlaeota bacterium]
MTKSVDVSRPERAKRAIRLRRVTRFVLIAVVVIVLTCGLALFGLLWINYSIIRMTDSLMVTDVAEIRPTTLAVVPGARIYKGGRLSAYLQDRVDAAIELYNAGKVKKILMSGDNSDRYYDESSAMRNYAIEHGVPEDDVLRDFAGLRTLDTVWRTRDIWGQSDFVIVTQRFHLPRALYLARALDIDVQGYVCDRRDYMQSVAARLATREFFARIAAWCDINILRTRPRHLGERESLSGVEQDLKVKDQRKEIWQREKFLRNNGKI